MNDVIPIYRASPHVAIFRNNFTTTQREIAKSNAKTMPRFILTHSRKNFRCFKPLKLSVSEQGVFHQFAQDVNDGEVALLDALRGARRHDDAQDAIHLGDLAAVVARQG